MTEERERELEIPTFQRMGIDITPAERVKKEDSPNGEGSAEYPLGGMVEPVDIYRENK